MTRVVPLKGMRGMIADAMVKSLATAAQLTHHASADASALLAHKARLADDGVKVSVEDLLMLAVVRALKKHPDANGRVEGRDITLADQIDLSVAIALPGNLLVAPAKKWKTLQNENTNNQIRQPRHHTGNHPS